MMRHLLIFLQLPMIGWGQATNGGAGFGGGEERAIASFDAGTPVVTIVGTCQQRGAGTTPPTPCEVVVTLAQFEKVIEAVQPAMPARTQREFALRYATMLVMAERAEELGLDSGERYQEQLRLARLQILAKEMAREIQQKAAVISDEDIGEYYKANQRQFEEAELSRIYLSKSREIPGASSSSGGEAGKTDLNDSMSRTAGDFRARAVAGEDFGRLQEQASLMNGSRSGPLPNLRETRRVSLPRDQQSVMDLDPGNISPVIADANGYLIYRVERKSVLPLERVREEIKGTLRSQRITAETDKIEKAANPGINEAYFVQLRSLR